MELQILFSRDPPIYLPGESVSGRVIIKATKSAKCRQVLIQILGEARNRWSVEQKQASTTFVAEITIISEELRVWGECVGKEEIPEGQLQFPFSFKLPAKSLPSFAGNHYGRIVYSVSATVDTGRWSFNKTTSMPFTVQIVSDIRLYPRLHETSTGRKMAKIGLPLFRTGAVSLQVVISRIGWAQDEIMDVEVSIDNQSSSCVDRISLELERYVKHLAYAGCKRLITLNDSWPEEINKRNARSSKDIIREKRMTIEVKPKTEGTLRLPFEIPQVDPSFESAIIRRTYYLKVSVWSGWTLKSTVFCHVPLIIGTVGLEGPNDDYGYDQAPPAYE